MTSYASARNETATQRVVRAFLILSSLALLAASIDRATWPFGYDESQSFASFNGRPGVLATANHHLLNTVLMRLCSVLFGNSELALRLPNVLAHGLYLFSALALVRRVRNPALQVLGFVVLNLNLLVIEYFAVARGYGLALAFQLFSLFLLVRGCEEPAHSAELLSQDPRVQVAAHHHRSRAEARLPLCLRGGDGDRRHDHTRVLS